MTWVQPEDLVGHELRQAAEDGRDARAPAARWAAAGGPPAPETAGASATPRPDLRPLAEELLDALAALPSPLTEHEPTALPDIRALTTTPTGTPPAEPETGAGRPSTPDSLSRGHTAPTPATSPPEAPSPRAPEDTPLRNTPPEAPEPREPGSHGRYENHGGTAPGLSGLPRSGELLGAGGLPETSGLPGAGGLPETSTLPETSKLSEADRPSATGGLPQPPAPAPPNPRNRPADDPGLLPRLHAAWLGRAAGCLLGKPVEKLPLPAIRALARAAGNWPLATWFTARGVPPELLAAHPWNRRSAATSLAENIDGMPEDDDLNYPLLGLLLLQRYGRDFTTADVARLWLDELPAGRTFTAERVAYRNLLDGVEPPLTAVRRNPFREWIGAQIRADVHGWTRPGDPVAAAAQAYRDAVLTHTGNGVYGAMFVAATVAAAASGTADVHRALAAGLSVVPPRSRLARAVRRGIAHARAHSDFDAVVDLLHAELGGYHWVHAVPNAALLAAALTHADGDFSRSVCAAVSGGWDTDSNGATAGSIAGLLAGHPDRLPERWTSPLENRLSTSVPSFDGIGFDTLAELTHLEAVRP
ncbi:ADP-ribosylglycohydrolase family protein [Streptomyces sp. NPDC085463]|uniref:ADP-ribosylglycohydrolase family protein n=1 Tax=Streptomyces sp. NPDC085463 TaxID=3365724 RepID=UPI0037D1B2A3